MSNVKIFTDEKTGLKYELIVGIETHVQILSNTKAFCKCKNQYGGIPNTRCCPTCLALPGAMPSVNKRLFESAILAATAFNCSIDSSTSFVRKNYFYPDLTKGYQITQIPQIATGGFIEIELDGYTKKISLMGLHMEEDVGKSIVIEDGTGSTYIDYNRAGSPLLEIVSNPDMNSVEEAMAYATALREIVRYIGISNGDMEEGSLRCDANINLKIYKDDKIYTTPITEIKNMNSFKFIKSAMLFEVRRQIDTFLLDGIVLGDKCAVKTTRRFDSKNNSTVFMRKKGSDDDYRFWSEPDLKNISLTKEFISSIAKNINELPLAMRHRFKAEYELTNDDCEVLTSQKSLAIYFEEAAKNAKSPKKVANWILSELLGVLKEKNIAINDSPIKATAITDLLNTVEDGKISSAQAKEVFSKMLTTSKSVNELISELGLVMVSDLSAIEKLADEVLAENQQSILDYKAGKDNALKYLMGQLMKKSKGTAKPDIASDILKKKLAEV